MAVQQINPPFLPVVFQGIARVRDWFYHHPTAAKVIQAALLAFSIISFFCIPFVFDLGGVVVGLLLTPPLIAFVAHRLLFPDRVVEIAQPPLQPVAPDHLALWAIWIERIGQNPLDLEHAPIELRDDKEILLIAVRKNAIALRFGSDRLKNDADVVLAAIAQHPCNGLLYASAEFKNNIDIVLGAVRRDAKALAHASEELKNNPLVVRVAISQDAWWGLMYASERLKNDVEIVREAIYQDGTALECASKEQQANEAIVREALQRDGKALNCVSIDLKKNRAIVLLAVRNKGEALRSAWENLRDDKEVVLAAVNEWGGALTYVSPRLLRDEEVLLAAVTNCHFAFKDFPADFKINRPFILRVLQQNGLVLEHLSEDFRRDPEIIEAAVRQNILARRYAL